MANYVHVTGLGCCCRCKLIWNRAFDKCQHTMLVQWLIDVQNLCMALVKCWSLDICPYFCLL